MSVYDSTGLTMDAYADILTTFIELAIDWKGESISTDEQELLGHLIRNNALVLGEINEIVQEVHDQTSVANSTGTRLDNLMALVGIERQSNAKSTATLTITVTKATTIPAGSLARTATKVYFATDSDLVFVGAGSNTVAATCTEDGDNNAAIGEISIIATTVNGWSAVTNTAAAIPGRYRETSADLKERHTIAVATSGDRDAASIFEAVTAVTGVSRARVEEDYTSVTPVSVYVIGGADADIAEAIDGQLTIGIGTAGTTAVVVYDETIAQAKTINFTRATNETHYISMTLTKNVSLYPADGDIQIRGFLTALYDGLGIGENVQYLSLPGAILQVPGVTINALYLGTAPSPTGEVDIIVASDKRATLVDANILIS